MPIDPVCGKTVSIDTPFKEEVDGATYYFCSEECQEEFNWTAEEQEVEAIGPYAERPETED